MITCTSEMSGRASSGTCPMDQIPASVSRSTPVKTRKRLWAHHSMIREITITFVVMRYGLNALNVINGVKKKLAEIKGSLPPGVEILSGYDRGGLISESISTLKHSLLEEAVIVSLVIIVFLFHFRSALIPILTLPIALVISFIPMYYLNVSSNIMSLGGLALAIGVLVDAAIVMEEKGYRHLSERTQSGGEALGEMNDSNGPVLHQETDATAGKSAKKAVERERVRILIDSAAKQVGPALFFSLLIIVVSFLP